MRRSKLTTLDAIVELVRPGSGLALGGVLEANRPAVFVRELIRRRVGELVLYSAPGSGWDADLLIGAGLVRRAMLPMVTMAPIGLAPSFRMAVERGEIEAPPLDAMTLVAAYTAAGYGHPYHLIASVEGTDIAADRQIFETLTDSAGRHHRAVRALVPDLCVLCVEEADEFGNLRHHAGRVADLLLARASRRTVVLAERILSNEQVRREPNRTTVPGHLVSAVVEAPFGAHPSSTAFYRADERHLRAYHGAAEQRRTGDDRAYLDYLERFVYSACDWRSYYEAIGGSARERELREAARRA